ncbi:MAG: Flp pilus assembly protein CpaB, partial [Gemmatimonadota bacterium]|nr:Flp pilus assembly protein CpaB [Gemmatimonadota bacterium]
MKKLWLVLGLALASGGLAAFLTVNYLGQRPSEALAAAPFRGKLAVAARDLPPGAVLGVGDIKLIDWPEEALPAGFVASPNQAVGRGILSPLRANEPLLSSKLAGEGAGGGLTVLIPEGMRAVSVKVDEVVGVAGFVVPGTRVDVLTTLTPRAAGASATTRLVLQNVEVAATGQSIERDVQGKPQPAAVITLLV